MDHGQFLFFKDLFILILMTKFIGTNAQGNIFQFSPDQPHCLGEEVTLTCYLFPTGPAYSNFVLISFNQSTPESASTTNTERASSGYSATVAIPVMGSSARIQLTIASFQVSDNNTLFGCHAEFSSDATVTGALESGYPPIATPPLPPTLTVSLTSLDPASCSGSVSIAWTPGDSDRSVDTYFLFLYGDLIDTLSSSMNPYSHSINIILDTNYTYSITANSCAGNSTQSNQDTIYVESYTLAINRVPFISYDNSTSTVYTNWTLNPNTETPPLLLTYSIVLIYSHTQGIVTYSYSDTVSFSQSSDVTSYSLIISQPNFSNNDTVVTNISACINITQQCGYSFMGERRCGVYSSDYTPFLSTITTLSPTVSTIITTTTTTTTTVSTIQFLTSVVIFVIIIILILILSITIITILVVVIVVMYRKNKHLQSLLKQVPTHPYEYIDLNTLSPDSPAIKSVPTDSTYYTSMEPVENLANTDPTHLYANLK